MKTSGELDIEVSSKDLKETKFGVRIAMSKSRNFDWKQRETNSPNSEAITRLIEMEAGDFINTTKVVGEMCVIQQVLGSARIKYVDSRGIEREVELSSKDTGCRLVKINDSSIFQIFAKSDGAQIAISHLKDECRLISVKKSEEVEIKTNKKIKPHTGKIKKIGTGVFTSEGDLCEVNASIINILRTECRGNGIGRARLCLHQNSKSMFHCMLIVMNKDGGVKPAKHLDKSESVLMIQGIAKYRVLKEELELHSEYIIGPFGNGNEYSFVDTEVDTIHILEPISEEVIFVEFTTGPFNRENTIEY